MLDHLDKQIYMGVVFDLNNTEIEGRWLCEAAKVPLMNIASKLGIAGRIYVGGFEELPKTHGESVFQISTYQDEGDLSKKLKDTFAAVGIQQDSERVVLILTNRLGPHNVFHYKKVLKLNQLKEYNNKVYLFGFEGCSHELARELEKEFGCDYLRVESLQVLESKLNQIVIMGG
jgi:hypothetical protein